ncbi:unnamed protein product, partial [marine sediment metagenome]
MGEMNYLKIAPKLGILILEGVIAMRRSGNNLVNP